MASKRLNGLKVVLVIAPDQFRDEELTTPQRAFLDEGAQVQIASTKVCEAKGMLGGTANVDVALGNLHADDIDCLVVVGGMGSPEYLWEDHNLHTLLKNLNSQGKVLGAICLSGAVLARAGVLSGKQATVYPMPESLKALKDGHATYVESPVVQDGRIITADGPPAAQEFAETLIKELAKVKV
ncbi:MAG TPA: DJ-1/PfpI family protein [Candidatus Melainabacteria bacterium]|jgi:protease I|nr:DJ-1/PfpI family protein [Candidatus Melainabacteria bacterium]